MKNLIIIIALLLIAPFTINAQANQDSPQIEADLDMATVVIYRTADFNSSATNWGIFNHRERLCKLNHYRLEGDRFDFRLKPTKVSQLP